MAGGSTLFSQRHPVMVVRRSWWPMHFPQLPVPAPAVGRAEALRRNSRGGSLVKPKIFVSLFSLFVATIMTAGYAAAHHSFAAEFDAGKPLTLKGIVVKWEMMNPHGWITVDVTGPGNDKVRWMVETSNPNGLMRLGWTKNSLKPGDQITIEAYRAKDGSNTANAARVTLADGRSVFAGSSLNPQASPGAAPQGK